MAEPTADGRDAVICGDWIIAHTENDIKAWKANVKKAGFLPSERHWLTDLIESGWVDVVRSVHPDVGGPYRPAPAWRHAHALREWNAPPRTRCGGPTTHR